MIKLWKLRNAFKVAINYIKTPYHILEPTVYSEDAHNHICFAHRFLGSNYRDVCPRCDEVDDMPGWADCCDWCKYNGVINYCKDENDKNSIRFYMDKLIVDTYEVTEEYKRGN